MIEFAILHMFCLHFFLESFKQNIPVYNFRILDEFCFMGYFGIILLQKLEKLWRFEVDQDFWRALYYITVVFTACSWAKCQVWQMPTIT